MTLLVTQRKKEWIILQLGEQGRHNRGKWQINLALKDVLDLDLWQCWRKIFGSGNNKRKNIQKLFSFIKDT